MASNEPIHIRGDTFNVTGTFGGADYTGWTGRSQVRDDVTDEILSQLVFTWIDPTTGSFSTQVKDTSNWPPNKYVVYDVELTSPDGVILSAPLIKILVMRDVTRTNA